MPSATAVKVAHMPEREDTFPLRRTLVETAIGNSVNAFQFGVKRLQSEFTTPTLVGAEAYVSGPLGELEFDVHSILCRLFEEAGAPAGNDVEFSLSALERERYRSRSSRQRARIAAALGNLVRGVITVRDVDPRTGEHCPGQLWELNLLEGAGATADYEAMRDAIRRGEMPALRTCGSLKGTSTYRAILPSWLANALRRGDARALNEDVQFELNGAAKSAWVILETQPFVQDGDEEESTVVDLTAETLDALGLHHARLADRRKHLPGVLARIRASDPSYLATEIHPHPNGRRGAAQLHVVRATGQRRQQLLREHTRRRLNSRVAA